MMRFRNVILVIVLSLSLVLVLSCYLVRNPYLGLAGYALQLIGDIMLIYSAMAGAKRKSRGKEDKGTEMSSPLKKPKKTGDGSKPLKK